MAVSTQKANKTKSILKKEYHNFLPQIISSVHAAIYGKRQMGVDLSNFINLSTNISDCSLITVK